VEIACPEDCVYLDGRNAPGWEGRETERVRDARRLAPFLSPLYEEQGRLALLALVGLAAMRSRHPALDDRLLQEAVSALHKTATTRARGVLYEHRPDDLRAAGIVAELGGLFEAADASGRVISPADSDLAAVLGAMEGAIRACRREQGGPRVFLDTASRVAGRLGGVRRAAPPGLILGP
jgi:hypothetical protein